MNGFCGVRRAVAMPMQRHAAFLLHLRLPRLGGMDGKMEAGVGGLFNELKVFYAKERRVE